MFKLFKLFKLFKMFTGPRPLNSSPTPPVYAWSVSHDLVDRTFSDHDEEDGYFDDGNFDHFDGDNVGHFDGGDAADFYANESPP